MNDCIISTFLLQRRKLFLRTVRIELLSLWILDGGRTIDQSTVLSCSIDIRLAWNRVCRETITSECDIPGYSFLSHASSKTDVINKTMAINVDKRSKTNIMIAFRYKNETILPIQGMGISSSWTTIPSLYLEKWMTPKSAWRPFFDNLSARVLFSLKMWLIVGLSILFHKFCVRASHPRRWGESRW